MNQLDAFLEDDLLRRMLERLPGEPTPMRQRPMTAAAVDPPTTQQERKQLLAFATQNHPRLPHAPGQAPGSPRASRRVPTPQ
jgi:hypothetical protein